MAKARGEVFCEYCGWTRSYEVGGVGLDSSDAACAEAREHGLTCDRHPLVQELRREKARTPEHTSCRETEQKLRAENGKFLEQKIEVSFMLGRMAKALGLGEGVPARDVAAAVEKQAERVKQLEAHRCIPRDWPHPAGDY